MSKNEYNPAITSVDGALLSMRQSGRLLVTIPFKFWTREVLLTAVCLHPYQLRLCARAGLATDEICLAAIETDVVSILDCPELKKDLCLVAIDKNPLMIEAILCSPNYKGDAATTAELAIVAVSKYGSCLNHPRIVQTPKLCMLAVEQDPMVIRFVKEQTLELCVMAIRSNPRALKFVRQQTRELCELAVSIDGMAIGCVRKQSRDLCLRAIKQHWNSILLIKNADVSLWRVAVRQNGYALQGVDNARPKFNSRNYGRLCMEAVKQNGNALQYIHWFSYSMIDPPNLSFARKLCLIAVRGDPTAIVYMPHDIMLRYVSRVIVTEKFVALADLHLSVSLLCEIGGRAASELVMRGHKSKYPLLDRNIGRNRKLMAGEYPLRWGELWRLAVAMRRMI